MVRDIKIWLLLRKLQKSCHELEVQEHKHDEHTGHSYVGTIPEHSFLEDLSKGDSKLRAQYVDLLNVAENNMKFLSSHTHPHRKVCKDCGCESGPPKKCIRLNSDGLEFAGITNLIEYLLRKYKLTLTLVILPLIALLIGLNWESIWIFITSKWRF